MAFMFHKNVSPSQLYKTTLIRTVSDATEIAFINKKGPKWALLFYCEQIKRLVKLPKYHFFQFAKQRKQSCPLIIVIKCTFCIRNRANSQWG